MNTLRHYRGDDLASDTVKTNIAALRDSGALSGELLVTQLCETARIICGTMLFGESASEEIREGYTVYADLLSSPAILRGADSAAQAPDCSDAYRALLAGSIYDTLAENGCDFRRFIPSTSDACKSVLFPRSPLAEQAYKSFLSMAPHMFAAGCEPSYTDSFDISCENASLGADCACILPTSTEDGGDLFRMRALSEHYDLKTCLFCRVGGGDSGDTVRFSLLRRSLYPHRSPRFAEIVLTADDCRRKLSSILSAADIFDVECDYIGALPENFSAAGRKYCVSFNGGSGHIAKMLLYLFLEHTEVSLTGLSP